MKIKILFVTMTTACLLLACSKDDGDKTPDKRLPISVEVAGNPMTNPDDTQTRSAIATAVTSPFYMKGKDTSYEVTKGSTTWSVSPSYWPIGATAEENVLFCAYTNGEYHQSANPYIHFTVSGDAYSQHDLLVATNTTSQSTKSGRVDLTFDHACAALQFSIAKTSNLAGYTIHVSKVQLCNVYSVGNYYFTSATWADLGTPANYTLSTATDMSVTETPKRLPSDESNDCLFLIPQKLTGWDKSGTPSNCYIKITCNITGAKTFRGDAYIPFGYTLDKGKCYPIKIAMGTGLRDGEGNKIFE